MTMCFRNLVSLVAEVLGSAAVQLHHEPKRVVKCREYLMRRSCALRVPAMHKLVNLPAVLRLHGAP